MKVWMTGGGGFVGSNIVAEAVAVGHDVLTTTHTFQPPADAGYSAEKLDMTDEAAVASSIEEFDPDLVIHCAILNDFGQMYGDRDGAWAAYVDATRWTVQSANRADAAYVLVSTDWVFDGTQAGADEETPPNPVNIYGVLKLASEMVALEHGGAVARVSGVQGVHRARPATPRAQDRGFGYLVASMVDAVREGNTFVVWDAEDHLNQVATPTLASEAGRIMLDIGERKLSGVFHCCGSDTTSRWELAEAAIAAFDLDAELVVTGPPDPASMLGAAIPRDTSLTTPRTSKLLEREATPLSDLLAEFRGQYEEAAAANGAR